MNIFHIFLPVPVVISFSPSVFFSCSHLLCDILSFVAEQKSTLMSGPSSFNASICQLLLVSQDSLAETDLLAAA
jgi:hypothetical protein